ncbi:Beta-galactosidase [Paenibacillus sp. UNCCL117]|uniref:beta-galactosidase n=1 Tax=unclassified Paenibacillus TaxID=185978 RepID=UPI00088B7BA8|nr:MULTISPECIES: beta-galactosidase [unclassified Paenibacillus]SDC96497.1 Beta-galactosidase [Paenibacillus sp. cl123]SFW30312.1 Beta-galactosidase [Paenibacillus sp. UNCCL117]
MLTKLPTVLYGGDYNPDQWPEELWPKDRRLFRAARVNTVTLPMFSRAKLQPPEHANTIRMRSDWGSLCEEYGCSMLQEEEGGGDAG